MSALFYILWSTSAGRYYVGHTTEPIDERVRKHISNHSGFTSKFKDWREVYSEEFPTKAAAYARELEVKRWKSSKRIERLIYGSEHPD